MKTTLNARESEVLQLLVENTPYNSIAARLGLRSEQLHGLMQTIRCKTGITDTKNKTLCALHVCRCPQPLGAASPLQLAVLLMLEHGRPVVQIARDIDASEQTVHALAAHGLKRAGIAATGKARLEQIKEYVARMNEDPAFT